MFEALEAVNARPAPFEVYTAEVLWTDASTFRLQGIISDDLHVDDYYIWVTGEEDDEFRRTKVVYAHADVECQLSGRCHGAVDFERRFEPGQGNVAGAD